MNKKVKNQLVIEKKEDDNIYVYSFKINNYIYELMNLEVAIKQAKKMLKKNHLKNYKIVY